MSLDLCFVLLSCHLIGGGFGFGPMWLVVELLLPFRMFGCAGWAGLGLLLFGFRLGFVNYEWVVVYG